MMQVSNMETVCNMFFTLLLICVFGQSEAVQPRSVNLALDTILEFNDKETDLKIIDNVQKFLGKIKNVLKDKNGRRSMGTDFKFTDYLITFFEMINKYDDDDLEDVVTVIDDEIRKYHYAGCKFFELLQNNDMRKFVGRKLNQIKDKSPENLRNDIDKVVDALKTETEGIKGLLDYINSLYPKESRYKLINFINNIELYKSKSKRANLELIKIIREGLRNAIFDHYTNLNVNARKDFKIRLETFWKNFMDPYRQGHKVWNMRYTQFDKHGSEATTKATSPMNHEFNDLIHRDRQENSNNLQLNTLKYFENTETTKTEVVKVKIGSKDLLRVEFPKIHLKDTTERPKDNNELNFSIKDDFSQNVPRKEKVKSIDKSIFGQFKDTPKDVVKEFEKSIDLNLPDIPKLVKEKFASITKDRLKIRNELFKDSSIHTETTTTTATETTEKPHKKSKNKPKKDKIKHKKAKRFSVVTESTTNKFYDSEEIYNINERKTTGVTKKKRKDKTKRKHKKDTKSTARSRFMTLYVEEYTGKVKKIRTRNKTAKHKHHTSWKDKTKKERSKDKKEKTKGYDFADSEEYTKKTTKSKKYRGHKHERTTKHHKKPKKYSKRSETTKKSRKWLKLPTESYEGMSIESFETKSYRKNIDFDDFQNLTAFTKTLNITIPSTIPTNTERIESTSTTFGTLDFWPGTNNAEKTNSKTILSSTKAVENSTMASIPLKSNKTFEKGKEIENGTLRLIDVKVNDFDITTKLPITTKNIQTKVENKTTIKTTKATQKRKVTTKKTKPPLLIRRSIGTTVKNKITTVQKTTTATKISNSTISTNITKPTFNLGEYLNQSEILHMEDKEKKDKIQEKILKDMQLVFSPTTTTTTKETNVFTDPFNEIDNALDI